MALRVSNLANRPILCAVLDGDACGPDPRSFAARLFRAGVDWIQLRDREREGDALYELAQAIVLGGRDARSSIEDEAPRVLINRRVDIAMASGADGVHLGFDAIAPRDARALLGADALIGASFHSVAEVEAASAGPLSYAHLAPIWDPNSKPASRPALGEAAFAAAARTGLPILAQGGVDEARTRSVLEAGGAGISVTGSLTRAVDPLGVVRRLRRALDGKLPPKLPPGGTESRNRGPLSGDTEAAS